MIYEAMYVDNLELCARFAAVPGCVVECGVWRGGMVAGIAEVLGASRDYFLFDSFEGLPPAREELDGVSAVAWQKDSRSPAHYNNCTAAESVPSTSSGETGQVCSPSIASASRLVANRVTWGQFATIC